MLIDVGQRFLNDPEQRDRELRRQLLAGGGSNFGANRDAGGQLELLTEIDHPLADLLFLHDDRPQLIDEGAHLGEHVIGLLDGAGEHRGDPVRFGGGEVARMLELEAERVDVLHQSVVHVAGDPVPLGDHDHLVLLVLHPRLQPQAFHAERQLAADLIQ